MVQDQDHSGDVKHDGNASKPEASEIDTQHGFASAAALQQPHQQTTTDESRSGVGENPEVKLRGSRNGAGGIHKWSGRGIQK